jgi:hypothetical protein
MAPAQGMWDAFSWRIEYRGGSDDGFSGEGVLVFVFCLVMVTDWRMMCVVCAGSFEDIHMCVGRAGRHSKTLYHDPKGGHLPA